MNTKHFNKNCEYFKYVRSGTENQRHAQLRDRVSYVFREGKASFLQQTGDGGFRETTAWQDGPGPSSWPAPHALPGSLIEPDAKGCLPVTQCALLSYTVLPFSLSASLTPRVTSLLRDPNTICLLNTPLLTSPPWGRPAVEFGRVTSGSSNFCKTSSHQKQI